MFKSLVLTVGLVLLVPVPEEPEPVELFAKEAWYKDQPGKEQDFVGILTKFETDGRVGGRFNPYRLILDGDKKEMREVYVGGKPELLAAYVGKKVKFVGKAVEMEVEGHNHREIWAARLFVLAGGDPAPKAKRVAILADHKLYALEPGQEKVFEGVLRKAEKGGYYIEMTAGKAVGKEDLILYGDTADPLAAFVGKQVRIGGKQVIGAVGMRKFQHTLPGWLELVDASGLDRDGLKRQIEALRQQLTIEEQRRKDIEAQFAQPMANPEQAIQLKRQLIESLQKVEEIKRKIAELEQQLTRPGAGATLQEIEVALTKETAALNAALTRFKEIEKTLANIENVTPAEFIQAKRDEPKVKAEAERAAQRVQDLQEQLKRLGSPAPLPPERKQPGARGPREVLEQALTAAREVEAGARTRLQDNQKRLADAGRTVPAEVLQALAEEPKIKQEIADRQARLTELVWKKTRIQDALLTAAIEVFAQRRFVQEEEARVRLVRMRFPVQELGSAKDVDRTAYLRSLEMMESRLEIEKLRLQVMEEYEAAAHSALRKKW